MSSSTASNDARLESNVEPKPPLRGRAFYESIGSPKMIVAPMVDRSEFAWRMLTRSYMDNESNKSLLAYTPMLHARLFKEQVKIRDHHFEPVRGSLASKEKSYLPVYLDGNPSKDRPLFVQFCANKPEDLLEAAQYVAPYCDAVDLNLGCPQGIARSGNYGAFLQEDWDTIYKLVNRLHKELPVPVTAKIRVLETKEKTLAYAKMILSAGASILTVHGRRREQKGHMMGIADLSMIRHLRDNLPPDTVLFANGNILNRDDVQTCLDATGADAVMSAEGNLSDPTIFAKPPTSERDEREYWRGSNGQGGYRIDGVLRRYMDIMYREVLEQEPPARLPLYMPSDPPSPPRSNPPTPEITDEPPRKKQKKARKAHQSSPNLRFMGGHLFQLLRPMLSTHTDIRDALAKCRAGDMPAFEQVLSMVEEATKQALQEDVQNTNHKGTTEAEQTETELSSSEQTIRKYKRPWWVCQPYIRPLPDEAIKIGAITLSKKDKIKAEMEANELDTKKLSPPIQRSDERNKTLDGQTIKIDSDMRNEALVCG